MFFSLEMELDDAAREVQELALSRDILPLRLLSNECQHLTGYCKPSSKQTVRSLKCQGLPCTWRRRQLVPKGAQPPHIKVGVHFCADLFTRNLSASITQCCCSDGKHEPPDTV